MGLSEANRVILDLSSRCVKAGFMPQLLVER